MSVAVRGKSKNGHTTFYIRARFATLAQLCSYGLQELLWSTKRKFPFKFANCFGALAVFH